MRRSYPFQDLGDEEFESLVCAICSKILGTGTIVFSTGKDGGRDAIFSGAAQYFPSVASPLSGRFVIQAKHSSNPVASCSDREFEKVLNGEGPKIQRLVEDGELDHYLVFTNRKKSAAAGLKRERSLRKLGVRTAHVIGIEQLRSWLDLHPDVWENLGFDRFESPLRIQTDDLSAIVGAFHETINRAASSETDGADFTFVPKPQKNKINKLSAAYFEEIRVRSLPYFKTIEDFLKQPRNIDLRDKYEDTTDEIRRKVIAYQGRFANFDQVITHISDLVTNSNLSLNRKRRFVAVFLHYMYYTCDIGQHAVTVETLES